MKKNILKISLIIMIVIFCGILKVYQVEGKKSPSDNYLAYELVDNSEMTLTKFSLITKSTNAGEPVYINMETTGLVKEAKVVIMDERTRISYQTSINLTDDKVNFILPKSLSTDDYKITNIHLIGNDKNNEKVYSGLKDTGLPYWDFTDEIVHVSAITEKEPIILNNISINSSKAQAGDKIYIELDANVAIRNISLVFENESGIKFTSPSMMDSDKKLYFIMPITETGIYSLKEVTLFSDENIDVYSTNGRDNSKVYTFNDKIESVDKDSYVFYRDELTNEVMFDILHNIKDGKKVTINTKEYTTISDDVLYSLMNKDIEITINDTISNNQIVFNGKDIKDYKMIDSKVLAYTSNKESNIGKLVSNAIIVELDRTSGIKQDSLTKVQARIKITKQIDKVLKDKQVYLYLYNKDTNDFSIIAKDIKKTEDGYYEFMIDTNSSYVLVDRKIDDSLVSISKDALKTFLLLFGLIVVIIVLVITIKPKENKKLKDIKE